MTSPPYWSLRDYGVKGQVGLEMHPQEYIDRLVSVFRELKRVLKPHGSFYLNLGDTYCSTKGSCLNAGGGQASIRQPEFRKLVARKNPNRMLRPEGGWLQPKQLLMMPARVAIALQNDGWILRNDIIWYKPNGLPNSVKDRLTNKYEHVYHFVRSRRYYYDLDAIRAPHKRGTRQAERDFRRMMKGGEQFQGKWAKAGIQRTVVAGHVLGRNPGDVLLFRTKTDDLRKINSMRNPPNPGEPGAFHPLGKNPGDVVKVSKHDLGLGKVTAASCDSLHVDAYHPLGKNPGDMIAIGNSKEAETGDFWKISTRPFPEAHFAVYPEDLCVRPILSSCPPLVCKACGELPMPVAKERATRHLAKLASFFKSKEHATCERSCPPSRKAHRPFRTLAGPVSRTVENL
ncbi:MAG: DNA-methyltransferase [Candidatus Binatia bacterium]